jgi:hypothetical protein
MKKTRHWISRIAVVVIAFLLIQRSSPPQVPELLKLDPPTPGRAGSLQVPIVHYERGGLLSGRDRVEFVGAIHLGEPAYYKALNERFAKYDSVLFELVADPELLGDRTVQREESMLGVIQKALAGILGLVFQLEGINYSAGNFVHADLSPQQLMNAMSARGESVGSLLLRIFKLSFDPKIKEEMERSGFKEPELEGINPIMIALRGPTEAERAKIKLFFAQGLVSSEVFMKALQGDKGIALIDDRNAAVIAATKDELSQGKRLLAIFYGVGHLPDLHKRLTEELGFSITEVEWVEAWNL